MLPITSYPPFSLEAFTETARIFRAGSFVEEKALLGICEFNAQGWLQGVVLGQPGGGYAAADASDDECAAVRELDNALNEYEASGYGAGEEGIDPTTILLFVQLVKFLIEQFWKKRNQR